MKVKDIIWTLFSILCFFTACSEETDLNGRETGTNTSMDVTFATNAIKTKTEATSPENTISKGVIAVFSINEGQPRECIGFKEFTFSAAPADGIYKVTDVPANGEQGQTVHILVIANSELSYSQTDTYDVYKDKIEGESSYTFKPSTLVKVGEADTTLGELAIEVGLNQLAARVDMKFDYIGGAKGENWNYAVTDLTIDGINSQSQIILGDYAYVSNKAVSNIKHSWDDNGKGGQSTFSFYTYEKATANSPVKIAMTGTLSNGGDISSTKKYILTLDPINDGKSATDGIVHGYLYTVTGNINIDTKDIEFYITAVKEWTSVDVETMIDNVHYLFVSETDIKMPNINEYTFSYTSDLDIQIGDVSATYIGYNSKGTQVSGKYIDGDVQYPTFTIDESKKTITVKMLSTPINYVPTTIKLTVQTKENELSQAITIYHYPTPYVEAYQNNDVRWGGVPENLPGERFEDSSQKNYNEFTVTSISSGSFVIGDPRDENGKTRTDKEANNLVSPKFVIASQRGITNRISYSDAQKRCSLYTEIPYMTVGTWRIPTTAELQYIAKLQNDSNSAVEELLEGTYYWSAYYNDTHSKGTHVYLQNGSGKTNSSNEEQYVRCVHDVY